MFTSEFLKETFEKALSYEDYLGTGTEEQRRRWQEVYQAVGLIEAQKKLLGGFVREMKMLLVSGIWCGDCVAQGPMLARIAESCPRMELRCVDRDAAGELRDQIMICAGARVPMVVLMAEDYAFCALYGDRTLSRYRAVAQKQLGAACSTGLFVPEARELADTLQDWLNEVERVQLMLRLSTRLRQKHND